MQTIDLLWSQQQLLGRTETPPPYNVKYSHDGDCRGRDNHGHDHDLIAHGQHGIGTGKNLAGHHFPAGKRNILEIKATVFSI
jgi:hypothetical protein